MAEPGRRIAGRIQLRLMWPLTVLLLLNSLDRVNVSYGALQMNKEIGLDASGLQSVLAQGARRDLDVENVSQHH